MADDRSNPSQPRILHSVLVPGFLAGVLGGVAMGLVAIVHTLWREPGPFEPLALISGLLLQDAAADGGAGAVLLGLVIHLLVAGALGVGFAALAPEDLLGGSRTALGVFYGLIVYAAMSLLVVPAVNPAMHQGLHHGWFLLEHVVYGVAVGVLLGTLRRAVQGPAHLGGHAAQRT